MCIRTCMSNNLQWFSAIKMSALTFSVLFIECSAVEEEVIAAHGMVEEFIAFDNM